MIVFKSAAFQVVTQTSDLQNILIIYASRVKGFLVKASPQIYDPHLLAGLFILRAFFSVHISVLLIRTTVS